MAKFNQVDFDFDWNNRRTYAAKRTVRQYQTATGWLEPGEQAAFALIAEQIRGGSILDIGVGGGRTAPLMLVLSSDYRGIDYCPTLVDVARSRFPHLQFLKMDARRLSFADSSFDLAAFSYNGIDSVNLAGRREVLHNVYRVLRPGGYFVFSALNRQGSAHGDHWPEFGVFHGVGWSPNRLLRAAGRFVLGGANWLRLRHCARDEEDVAIGSISAHNFGLLTLFTSLKSQLLQLADTGFQVEAVFEPEGRRLAADGSEATNAPWYHFVARKPISEAVISARAAEPDLASRARKSGSTRRYRDVAIPGRARRWALFDRPPGRPSCLDPTLRFIAIVLIYRNNRPTRRVSSERSPM